jgi:hypothetical protein
LDDLPARVRQEPSPLQAILLDPGNPFFEVSGDFLIETDRKSIVRYFGSNAEVVVPAGIEQIAAGCFSRASTVS